MILEIDLALKKKVREMEHILRKNLQTDSVNVVTNTDECSRNINPGEWRSWRKVVVKSVMVS